ncbi:MAG: SPASM domain-containing protein, partial [Thermodesulfobacteriota bacterium]|nr:SPASM domain-containing protein [Thermodesulfobacteriota bacterium]
LPSKDEFRVFLEDYVEASRKNPIIGIKDNLGNIIHQKKGMKINGGCTGYGCGTAFNFFVLLPDGEIHACRKFPSLLGNIFETSLSDIYDSKLARMYRAGPYACRLCSLRPSCGGCLASAHNHGLDIFMDRDPYCFIE